MHYTNYTHREYLVSEVEVEVEVEVGLFTHYVVKSFAASLVQAVQCSWSSVNVGQLEVTKCDHFLPPRSTEGPQRVVTDKGILLLFVSIGTTELTDQLNTFQLHS